MGKICTGITDVCKVSGYTSSIPTKYQTVVICNEEKKGFSSQSKRFSFLESPKENPGPATYCSFSSAETFSPSFSKKGTTSFPTKVPRVPRPDPQRCTPGPDTYNLQSSPVHHHSFGRGPSRAFRAPVAVPPQEPKFNTPGPNQYDVRCSAVSTDQRFPPKGSSAFLSKTERCRLAESPNLPSPCHYQVHGTMIQGPPKVPLSPFRSKSSRFPAPVDHRVPGPGAYDPYLTPDPVRRLAPPRRHFLVIASPALPLPPGPTPPGPGQYDIVDYRGPAGHPLSSAAFVSGTQRSHWGSRTGQGGPGPGYYDPQKMSRQSFLYNPRIWNPV